MEILLHSTQNHANCSFPFHFWVFHLFKRLIIIVLSLDIRFLSILLFYLIYKSNDQTSFYFCKCAKSLFPVNDELTMFRQHFKDNLDNLLAGESRLGKKNVFVFGNESVLESNCIHQKNIG